MTDPFTTPSNSQEFATVVRGRYRHVHPVTGEIVNHTRVTTFAKTIEDTYGLGVWKQRMTLAGAASRPDIIAAAALLDPNKNDDKKSLDALVEAAADAAGSSEGARRGTAGHTLTDIVDRGDAIPPGVSEEARRDVESYRAKLEEIGLEVVPEYMERTGCQTHLGVTGTLDRLYRVKKTGELIVGDYKTTKNIAYAWLGYSIQVCVYSRFDFLADKAAGKWEPMPEVSQTQAVILQNPVGSGVTHAYMVDLEAAVPLVNLSRQVRAARSGASKLARKI